MEIRKIGHICAYSLFNMAAKSFTSFGVRDIPCVIVETWVF